MAKSVHKARHTMMRIIYDLESNDSRNVLSPCQIVPYDRDFLPFKFFFNVPLKTLAFSYLKTYREPMK